MNKLNIKLGFLAFLLCTVGSSYESARAKTTSLFCPPPKLLTYKKGKYTGEVEIVSNISNRSTWKEATSGENLPRGDLSYTGTTVINDFESSKIEMDCDYNISVGKHSRSFSLRLEYDLKDKSLANKCTPTGCTGRSDTVTKCFIECATKTSPTPKP